MNKFYTIILSFVLLSSVTLVASAQQHTHYDNKPYISGEMLVQLGLHASVRDLVAAAPTNFKLEIIRELSKPMRVWLVQFDEGAVSHRDMQAWFYNQKQVTLADYNYKIQTRSSIPNDNNFSEQWHHNNTGQTGGTDDADIDSDLAWDITTGGQTANNDDIVVCLIESGNLDHQDLTGNRWVNIGEVPGDGIDNDGNGYIDDINGWNPVAGDGSYGTGGHGTNCLGMIGAKGDNNADFSTNNVVGANWDVKLMVVGNYSISTQANAIEAYTYPLEMRQLWNNTSGAEGALVVATSSSWGIDGADPLSYPIWCSFYDTLGRYGILNVGATTNSNLDVDAVGDMPTACDSDYMIGVGRTDHNDETAGGYGQTTIEFGAPGIDVVTTANTNSITTTTGTSFSCPLTAGVIGLAYSIPCADFMSIVMSDPQEGADLVRQALLDGTDAKTNLTTKFVTGGRLNSRNTLDELMNVVCTGGFCLAPSSILSSNITETSVDIIFSPFGSASEQLVYWREVGASAWTLIEEVTSPLNLDGLVGCTEYEFYMQSVCDTELSDASAIKTFSTTGCGACIDLTYCPNFASNEVDEWIDAITIGTYMNTSGNDNGYGNYTTSGSIPLDIDVPYDFELIVAWSGTEYNEYSRVWIDLDQSGTFEESELLFDQGAGSLDNPTGIITIPPGALPGNTRMRVQMAYVNETLVLPGICSEFTFGEVEDYCVDLIDVFACDMSVSSTITNPTCDDLNDGEINLIVSGGSAPYSYELNGFPSTNYTTGLAAGTYTMIITDNAGCDTTVQYELLDLVNLELVVTGVNVSCNGADDGAATAVVTGSTGYTYAWTDGSSGDTSIGLERVPLL